MLELPAPTSCRSARMFTAIKSFERFWQPRSVEDEKKSVDDAVPKSTAYKTKWSCKVCEEWKQNRVVKSGTLDPGGLFATKDRSTNFGHGHHKYVRMQSQLHVLAVAVRSRSKQFFWGTLSFPLVVLNYLRTEAPPF